MALVYADEAQKHQSSSSNSSERSESLAPQQQFSNFQSGVGKLRSGEFTSDIFNDHILTPHEEMRQTWRMITNNIQISQALTKKTLMVLGREITVNTDDDTTKEFYDQNVIPKLRQPLFTGARNALGAGNGHIEILRGESTQVPKDFEQMRRPHKIYNQYEGRITSKNIVGYVQEAFRRGRGDMYNVTVSHNRSKKVRGDFFPAENVIHLQVGSSAMPGYGRSDFASGIDDYKISRELKHAQGLIARHKSMPRIAWVFNNLNESSGIDEPGDTFGQDQRQQYEDKLSGLRPDENPVFYNLDLEKVDYSYDPKTQQMQNVLEKLDRDLTSPIPQFLTHAENSNRANSKEERNFSQMEASAIRERWRSEIDPVLQEIAEAQGLDTDVSIQFGDFDFPTREEKVEETLRMWKAGVLTLGQAVNRLPFQVDVPAELEDAYEWELKDSQNPFQDLQNQLDDIQDVDMDELQDMVDAEGG